MDTNSATQLYARAKWEAMKEVPTSAEIAGLEYRHVAFAVYCMRRGRGIGMPYVECSLEPIFEANETDGTCSEYQ